MLALSPRAARYASFDGSELKDVTFAGCDISEGSFSSVTHCRLSFSGCALHRTIFRSTPLAGIGLAASDISGIVLSENPRELRGAVLDAGQALDIVRLFGAEIR